MSEHLCVCVSESYSVWQGFYGRYEYDACIFISEVGASIDMYLHVLCIRRSFRFECREP